MARSALDVAIAYAKERESFGTADLQPPGGGLSPGRVRDKARSRAPADLARRALRDAGRPCLKEAAMAKLFASETAEAVCSAAIQTLGGYGYVSDFPVERIYRDVRVCQIYEGTSTCRRSSSSAGCEARRPAQLALEPGTHWLGLAVRAHRLLDDSRAEVEFVARSRAGGGPATRLHERSRFVRENTQGAWRWFYVDGDFL
jgi:hypothetical protein